jgi:transcriptional regulator with XRE-family HTH domain
VTYQQLITEELKTRTIRELAEGIGITPSHVLHLRDNSKNPHPKIIDRLVKYFNRPKQELLAGNELDSAIMQIVRHLDLQDKQRVLDYITGKYEG